MLFFKREGLKKRQFDQEIVFSGWEKLGTRRQYLKMAPFDSAPFGKSVTAVTYYLCVVE